MRARPGRRWNLPAAAAALVGIALVAAAAVTTSAQEQSVIFLYAMDRDGVPILELEPSDLAIREDVGASSVVSIERFGWPLEVTVLLDNGPATREWLVHYRNGLKKFFAGLPPGVPVSLIATAPAPRWLFRDTTDRVQIENGVDRTTPDDGLGRFSDALIEYSRRLDEEFRNVTEEQLPPYLPVLVSVGTSTQDGSLVRRDDNAKMITSLRKHRTWTNLVLINPSRGGTSPVTSDEGGFSVTGGVPSVFADEGQNAEVAKALQEYTGGRYIPMTGSGTSGLATSVMPELARDITLRYIRQMSQHRIVIERPTGAAGPMKAFSLRLSNHPGAKIVVSTDGNLP
jgi:hypothetical protein